MNLVKYYIQGRQADTIQDMKHMNDCNLVNIAHEFVLEEGFSESDVIALAESHLVTKPWRFLWIASSESYATSDELLRTIAYEVNVKTKGSSAEGAPYDPLEGAYNSGLEDARQVIISHMDDKRGSGYSQPEEGSK